jgi:hypothetical protein
MNDYKYALERLEYAPFKLRNELTKNMTNLPMRWKVVMVCDDIEKLRFYLAKGRRIIDYQTGEVLEEKK